MPDKNFYIDEVNGQIKKYEVDVIETRTYKCIELFCYQKSAERFNVIENRSKLLIEGGKSVKDAFYHAEKIIDKISPERIEQLADEAVKKAKEQYSFILEPNVLDIFA